MYQGKHSGQASSKPVVSQTPIRQTASSAAPRRAGGLGKKSLSLLAALALILALAVSGTVAWLNSSDNVSNSMVPGNVPIDIDETIDNMAKTSVKIVNKGNIQAYIRVAVVSNQLDDEGNVIPNGSGPAVPVSENWQLLNGYYYYKGIVEPGASVELLAQNSRVDFSKAEVNILAQSIQVLGGQTSDGSASKDIWGVSFNGTEWA